MNKKVVHLTSVHKRYDIRIYLKECCSLSNSGYDVYLIVADGKGDEIKDDIKIIDVGISKNKLSRIIFSTNKVFKKALELNADVYHFHDSELLFAGMRLKKKNKVVVYDSHEDFPRQIYNKQWLPLWTRKPLSLIIEFIENYISRRLDAVVCPTELIKNRFLKLNKNSIDIRNYVIVDEFSNINKNNFNHNICYVGVITRERGFIELLDAIDEIDDIKLICCGPFESLEFEEKLKKHKSWKKVDYRGIVGRKKIADIMEESSAGIVTLLNTPNQIESLPIKLFEYMASCLPVIASNFPLWIEIVENAKCGICVDPSNSKEIASAISYIFDNPEEAQNMGKNGKKNVDKIYNWKVEEKKLIELYKRLLND
ncbi:glycosyltransferase family 4 protein [Arcobacter porcinus]|uniref:glycosyltransferase family 4 protein n=1 Tax=Arcobacter porcinus TaxID=1935204 RepID=UPI000825320F|nr:glycosyltransferase family 4 protein [Arcobacter porcinus]OCL85611.1 Alpha-D-kanosaminyltransferase [Arcobacter porcinus]